MAKQGTLYQQGTHWIVPILSILGVYWIDRLVEEVTFVPLAGMILLIFFSFYVPHRILAFLVIVYAVVVLWALGNLGIYKANDFNTHLRIVLRVGTFLAGGVLAVLFSRYRSRLLKRNREIRHLLEKIPAPVVVSDAAGYITWLNEDAVSFFGKEVSEVKGQRYVEWLRLSEEEGPSMRFYIQFFQDIMDVERDVTLVKGFGGGSEKRLKGRILCIGEGEDRQLVTLILGPDVTDSI